jgi:integrase/recombinase XerD
MKTLTAKKAASIFHHYLKGQGYRKNTIRGKMWRVGVFLDYLERNNIDDVRDVDRERITGYLNSISERISSRTAKPYALSTRRTLFATVRALFHCLYVRRLILLNPAQGVRFHPRGSQAPKAIMSQQEIAGFLDGIEEHTLLGPRDRALFELLYSSGLRAGEAAALRIQDIDFENRMLLIRNPKWGKDRIEPISEVAATFLARYLAGRTEGLAFWGLAGPLRASGINRRFKTLLQRQGVDRPGLSVHCIRHAVATHLLASGADLRYVQELLGHRSIQTTVGYTQELYENLKRIYKTYHPRENEYYKEIDPAYLGRLQSLEAQLAKQREVTRKKRRTKRRWYEKHRRSCS